MKKIQQKLGLQRSVSSICRCGGVVNLAPRGAWGGCCADMADLDPRYPCSSIEDDFNYGSCVASASVHIRMGTSPGPSRPALGGPAASPASGGWFSASEASFLRDQPLGIPPVSWVERAAFPPPSGPWLGRRAFSLRMGSEAEARWFPSGTLET